MKFFNKSLYSVWNVQTFATLAFLSWLAKLGLDLARPAGFLQLLDSSLDVRSIKNSLAFHAPFPANALVFSGI